MDTWAFLLAERYLADFNGPTKSSLLTLNYTVYSEPIITQKHIGLQKFQACNRMNNKYHWNSLTKIKENLLLAKNWEVLSSKFPMIRHKWMKVWIMKTLRVKNTRSKITNHRPEFPFSIYTMAMLLGLVSIRDLSTIYPDLCS